MCSLYTYIDVGPTTRVGPYVSVSLSVSLKTNMEIHKYRLETKKEYIIHYHTCAEMRTHGSPWI